MTCEHTLPLDGFDETLQKLGVEWMDESVGKINAQSAVMKNASFIILGGVFMWIASGILPFSNKFRMRTRNNLFFNYFKDV